MLRSFATFAALALLLPLSLAAQEGDPVAYATSAAPASISAEATVIDMEGNVLREGTNEWTCIPAPGQPMCLDPQWMTWFDAYVNQRDHVQVDAVGLAYMLQGDPGASNIDPYAEGPTPDNEWVVTGPHIMLIVPDPAMLEGIPTDPTSGGPYVMWRGHHLAHVMIPVVDDAIQMPHD
jgi:hypothetical protein